MQKFMMGSGSTDRLCNQQRPRLNIIHRYFIPFLTCLENMLKFVKWERDNENVPRRAYQADGCLLGRRYCVP